MTNNIIIISNCILIIIIGKVSGFVALAMGLRRRQIEILDQHLSPPEAARKRVLGPFNAFNTQNAGFGIFFGAIIWGPRETKHSLRATTCSRHLSPSQHAAMETNSRAAGSEGDKALRRRQIVGSEGDKACSEVNDMFASFVSIASFSCDGDK